MRRFASLAFATVVLFVVAAPARADIPAVKVIDEPGTQQVAPSGNGTWFAFTANSAAHVNRFNAYAALTDGSGRTRLNPKGTGGFTGNFDPGTNTVIYSQYSSTTPSNLWFFNLDGSGRTKVPGVNTKWFEYNGLVSTSFILFDRDHRVNGVWYTDLILFNRAGSTATVIGSWKSNSAIVLPGSVGETTAAFDLIKTKSGLSFNPYVYDITGATRTKIPVPSGKFAYSPSVDETNGEVYFTRSGNGCGVNVTIRRVALSDVGGA